MKYAHAQHCRSRLWFAGIVRFGFLGGIVVMPLLLAVTLPAQEVRQTHQQLRAEAVAAYERKDYAAAREATLAALELRPDSPRYLHNLAALSARLNDPASALHTLQQLAALGVAPDLERDPDLASLQGSLEFRKVLQLFAANREPRGEAELFAELGGRTGIIEGIASRDRTGEVFLGDVYHRCIWRRARNGEIARFTAEDNDLFGIFAIAIDEPRNTVWAAMSAVPEMSGYTPEMKGYAALAEFDLATSELRRVVPVPDDGRDHALSDLVVDSTGTVYASDSKAPVVWMLLPDAEELQTVVDSPLFGSLQGLVIEKKTLLVADHENGLFTVDLGTRNITALVSPRNVTLTGIDGMVPVPGGIVAVQNGVVPQRVIRVALTPALDAVREVTILAAALPHLTDLSLVTLVNERPAFIAGAGWEGLDPNKAVQPAPHTVRIFQVTLPGGN